MKPQEKATELIEKFGCNALEVLEETFLVWNIKRDIEINKINKGKKISNYYLYTLLATVFIHTL